MAASHARARARAQDGASRAEVCTIVDPPSKAKAEIVPLTVDQVAAFHKAIAVDPTADPPVAAHRLEALFLTVLGTGCR